MKLSIVANPQKYSVKDPFLAALDWADEQGVKIYFNSDLNSLYDASVHESAVVVDSEEEAINQADIVIAMGGDGTMLYTTRLMKNIHKPILGVNSGRLGFMANTQKENLATALECIQESNYRIDKRHLLQAEDDNGNIYHALNEFLFSKRDSTSMITVDAEYDDMFINTYWADGLIVASPTGSTAYNLSSGGPIVMPNTDVMVLTPINPHTLTTRPLVLPSDKSLKITVEEQQHEVLFSYDGEIYEIEDYPFQVEIKRSNFTIDLIELPNQSYFETLRNKLMWGMDSRKRY
ncbi:NAD(+)/NADH kinase [Aliifodinibius sp. S!AR15-10]|uniref:NAD(+)/NADH kinase n=1 Tax=Aliifodinibius sp. S!AR15-10 TaxID=2950437 RepID=UPI0028609D09|nr:NAD(+)/NADH kinase [Aliifodinibius sp. S!AR15-10]MDR8392457.1 NAD(+)/NADH kinase [Aliifodinibius sp. S!AR15-10]